MHRKLKEYGIKTRNHAESHIIYPRKDFSDDKTEKAYLIGFKIGDLRVRKIWENGDTILIDCASTIKEQIDLIEDLFSKYGKVWISKPNDVGNKHIEARVNSTFSFLLDKKAPDHLFKKEEYFFPFLAGFIDAEGSIKIYNDQAVFQIGNYDKPLLELIIKALDKLGIECKGPYKAKIKGYKCSGGYKHNQDYYSIRIFKKPVLLKLIRILKPYIKHENKRKDFKKAEINILERNRLYGE